MQITVGNTIDDRYEIIRPIASGGFATVFQAYQKQFDRMVAVKVLDKYALHEPDALPRFEREAKAASGLRHKNVVGVYGFGLWHESPYMVLEYVEGVSLQHLIRTEGKLAPKRAAAITAQICEALEAAHNAGIIHRDLKPQNVMLTKGPGETDLVKIIDFGLAKLMPGFGIPAQKLTEDGAALGTCLYMPPEQCTGFDVDNRADIYSTGCILYESLTGSPPFVADSNVAIMFMHLNNAHASIDDTIGKDAEKRRLAAIVNKAMAKDRDERYNSAQEFLVDLNAMLAGNEPTFAKRAPAPNRPAPTKTRRKAPLTAAIAVTLCLVAVGFIAINALQNKNNEEIRAAKDVSSLDLFRQAFNDGRQWDRKVQGDRRQIILDALAANAQDKRLDPFKLYELHAILTGEESRIGDWQAAYDSNEKSIAYLTRHSGGRAPQLFSLRLCKSDCMYHLGKRDQAIAMLQEIIDAPPDKYPINAKGHAYFQLWTFANNEERTEDAIEYGRKACAMNGDAQLMRAARLCLGNSLILANRAPEAEPVIREALNWPGTPFNAGDLEEAMLRCYVTQGKFDKALKLRKKIQKSDTTMPHPFNVAMLTIATSGGLRARDQTIINIEDLAKNGHDLMLDSEALSTYDTHLTANTLNAVGFVDLSEQFSAALKTASQAAHRHD